MKYYVNIKAGKDGDGSKERPFKRINDAAKIAVAGDEVLVAPGIYREYVNPQNAGTEDARITYTSEEPLGAVITGAEVVTGWKPYEGTVWTARVDNGVFGRLQSLYHLCLRRLVFCGKKKHTGCVYLNDKLMYETVTWKNA